MMDAPAAAPEAGPVFQTTFEAQWGDCDAAGIVFYPNFFRYMDAAFHRLLRSLGTGQREIRSEFGLIGTPLLEARATFQSPVRYDDVLAVSVRVADVGGKSLRLGYEGRVGTRLAFAGEEVRAFVEERDGALRATPIPSALRARLAP